MATKIQLVFYSMYGHVYRMAEAIVAGAREVAGTKVALYQVAELVPNDVLEKSGAKAARAAFAQVPLAKPEQLADAHAILFGTPTRFGNMCAQMRNFLDQTGGLWMSLQHMDHSPRFWRAVASVYPDFAAARRELHSCSRSLPQL